MALLGHKKPDNLKYLYIQLKYILVWTGAVSIHSLHLRVKIGHVFSKTVLKIHTTNFIQDNRCFSVVINSRTILVFDEIRVKASQRAVSFVCFLLVKVC